MKIVLFTDIHILEGVIAVDSVNEMKTIGIIGSAGRGDDYNKLNLDLFVEMHEATHKLIEKLAGGEDYKLVSGGAAFCDHIAVSLFLGRKVKGGLILHLPAPFANNQFHYTKDGNTANYYHHKFSRKVYPNEYFSLEMIGAALDQGAEVTICNSFIARNAFVARDADYMIALTFGNKGVLKRGGTWQTMETFLSTKLPAQAYHICLPELWVYNVEM